MFKCVIYLHGWRGNPEANTKKAVATAFPGVEVVAFNVFYEMDVSTQADTLEQEIQQALSRYKAEEVVMFGNSAGGFWARHFAAKFGLGLVLTNPSFDLGHSLKKYDVDQKILDQYLAFVPCALAPRWVQVFVGAEDDIVDHANLEYDNVVILPGEGHRIKDFGPIINKLKELF